jgi:type VI secretion system protein ImpL
VDDYFRTIRDFATPAAPGQPAPIDSAVTLMNEVYVMLVALKKAEEEKIPAPPSPTPDKARIEATRYPEPLRSMVSSLADSALRDSVDVFIGDINKQLRAQVTDFCTKALTQRFPFVASNQDVTQEDFITLFGPGGKIDAFYQTYLQGKLDTSGAHWRFKPTQGLPLTSQGDGLDEFRRAQVIREVFFPSGSRTPVLRFEFKPIEMDAAIQQFTLDVDGQLLKYAHGPQIPMQIQFPGPKNTTQVRVSISPPTASGNSGFVLEGPWALFRLFQTVQMESTAQSERFRATIAVEDRKVTFEIYARSVQNPLKLKELAEFHCPQAL